MAGPDIGCDVWPAGAYAMQMRHVHAAIQEMFNTSHVIIMRTASRLDRLLLAALHLETRFSGRCDRHARVFWAAYPHACTHNCSLTHYGLLGYWGVRRFPNTG
jgi:hypothetical protein